MLDAGNIFIFWITDFIGFIRRVQDFIAIKGKRYTAFCGLMRFYGLCKV